MITKNMGTIDRVIRIILALVILYLYMTGKIGGTTATIGLIVSAIFILTSFFSFCPLYYPFNLSTRRHRQK